MADAAITFLIENLKEAHICYAYLLCGAHDQQHQLVNDLEFLQGFLRKAAFKLLEDEPFREMERKIREIVYDVEDTIDSCFTQSAVAKGRNRSLSKEIKSLRENKLKPVLKRVKLDFASINEMTEKEVIRAEVDFDFNMVEDPIIGFTDLEEQIISYLTEETEELDIISIIGMPGLGKTTLSWKIYQNQDIQYEFPTRIWVYVSQEFDPKDVFLNILKEITSEDMSSLSRDELAQTVRESLKNIKFLLVLDDIWTVEVLNDIKDALPMSNSMGKVLITSRQKSVGKHANIKRDPHMLRFLTNYESWELLQLEVFGSLDHCPEDLVDIGRNIAMQCQGLGFLVVVIGGILKHRFSVGRSINEIKEIWSKMSENMSMLLKEHQYDMFGRIIALSYNNLPDDLKICFIYLGVFPEDFEIPVSTLTRLWITEGFVQHKEGQSLEETAEKNLNELISSNLVMVAKTNPRGKVKLLHVHNQVREFCNYIAAIAEQNLFQEVKINNEGLFHPPISDIQKYRRLSIHSSVMRFILSEPNGPRVRSFLHFSKHKTTLPPEHNTSIPDAFELLRVLDAKSIKFTRFPFYLTQLVHLRYIVLSSNFKVLPEVLCNMCNIQTLIVYTTSRTLEMKADIQKMIQLRHVHSNASIILCKVGSRSYGNENLQTLAYISPESCTNKLFQSACNLKKLGIRGRLATLLDSKSGSSPFDSLGNLSHLEKLKLLNDVHPSPLSEGQLLCLPPPSRFPKKLISLTLSGTSLDWKHMSVLGMLENLRSLKLKNKAFMGRRWEVADGGFYQLEVLQVEYTNLVEWKASSDHFPRLQHLGLRNCEELKELPVGLADVFSLRVINLYRTTKSCVVSAKKIERATRQTQRPMTRGTRLKLFVFPPDLLQPDQA